MNIRGPLGLLVVTVVLAIASAGPAWAADASSSSKSPENDTRNAAFSYEKVVAIAEARARKPYKAPQKIPEFLRDLDFAGLDRIGFKRDKALWHDPKRPFSAMFYHPGSYYERPVTIHVVDGGSVKRFDFDKQRFSYPGDDMRKRIPEDLGYAGLKLLHELDDPGKMDEVLSFLGASYFRSLGANEHYGLSARGLAIDTASDQGEEFPMFTDFWLVEPDPSDASMTVFAVLDSPSVAGAYKVVVTPGETTRTRVESTLFTRKPISKLGVAPLTSMFMWGENSLTRLDNYRPEAHDSDGLQIAAESGEWLWRPLVNPRRLLTNQFSAKNVRGFGLIQRDRDFDHYQDLNYDYQRRPNAWITPRGDWGDGHLELVQIPSDSEVNDNIAMYWVPETPVTADERLHFEYDIAWGEELAGPESLGHVAATRVGRAAIVPGQTRDTLRVAIEFVGGGLEDLTDDGAVQPRVDAMRDATINNIQAVRNPHTGGWRLTFLVPAEALEKPLELRAFLADPQGGALTETWSYTLSPRE